MGNSTFWVSPNTLLVGVVINPSSGNTIASTPFPTQQELQNRKIIAIETYASIDVEFDPTNPDVPVLTPDLFKNAFLTLYTSNPPKNAGNGSTQAPGLFYDKVPLVKLRTANNNDEAQTPLPSFSRDVFRIRPTELAFNKCKVEFPTPIAMTEQHSALFLFHYLDIGDDGARWM